MPRALTGSGLGRVVVSAVSRDRRLRGGWIIRPSANAGGSKRRNVIKELGFKLSGDYVGLLEREAAVEGKVQFGGEAVANPAGAHIEHSTAIGDMLGDVADLRSDVRFDAVQHAR